MDLHPRSLRLSTRPVQVISDAQVIVKTLGSPCFLMKYWRDGVPGKSKWRKGSLKASTPAFIYMLVPPISLEMYRRRLLRHYSRSQMSKLTAFGPASAGFASGPLPDINDSRKDFWCLLYTHTGHSMKQCISHGLSHPVPNTPFTF